MADYKPISDYGVIGDMHTAALVGLDGSIDWYCAPRFDSPSVFAALLDARKGGRFQLSPIESFTTKQSYEGDSNVLSTIFESKQGRIKLTDFMPCFMEKGQLKGFEELHRIVDCVDGELGVRIIFQPRLDYARGQTTMLETQEGCVARCQRQQINLASSLRLHVADKDTLTT
jgi:GH15 family glucan-1,4-alpha-glucosidase